MQGADIRHELAARSARPFFGCGHRDLPAELIRFVRLAFADAFHLGGVQRVDLWSDLTPLLIAYAARPGKLVPEVPRVTGRGAESLRSILRVTQPSLVRKNFTSRRRRWNCLA